MLLLLWSLPNASAVGIEAQQVSAALARRSIRYNGVEHRTRVVNADFRDAGALSSGERFDLVTGSPPYLLPAEGRRSERPQRGPCRFEDRGGVGEYLRVAEAHLSPVGCVVWVHATRYAPEVLEAADRCGLRRVRWRTVQFVEGGGSLISLFSAARSEEWRSTEDGPLVVRRRDREWSEEYRALRGEMGFPS
jgi:tRNA1(Val) A37 N6-methylase TrmN6